MEPVVVAAKAVNMVSLVVVVEEVVLEFEAVGVAVFSAVVVKEENTVSVVQVVVLVLTVEEADV